MANLTYNDARNAKIGQTWSLLGWQPYYFPSEADVQPNVEAQLYRRFGQVRLTNTTKLLGDDWTLESAIDAAKPAELGSAFQKTMPAFVWRRPSIKRSPVSDPRRRWWACLSQRLEH